MRRERVLHRNRAVLALAVVTGLLACVTAVIERDVSPQEWWSERGPVVPHESFPADCSLCHTGDDWHTIRQDFDFDHGLETGVALQGAHDKAECLRCHNDRGPVSVFAQRGCSGCHEDAHRGELGENCESCHDEGAIDWRANEVVTAHQRTRFPLVGAHAAAACWRCHPGASVGNFLHTATDCATCHAADLAQATSPDHAAQGWVSDCQECHVPTTWSGAGFAHSAWPLTGAHKGADCSACHTSGMFSGTPTACFDCHMSEYAGTTDPNHQAGGFPTSCESCHDTSTWEGASFDHLGISTACADCHMDDYLATDDPSHVSAGFPTNCEACHGTNTWDGALFNHTFPINSGAHKEFDCADCHMAPSNFSDFSCTVCHKQGETGNDHDEVNGYVWESSACLACHPDGKD